MSNIAVEPAPVEQLEQVAKCHKCRRSEPRWNWITSYSVDLYTGAKKQISDEIRCAYCGAKAVLQNNSLVRSTEEFKRAFEKENPDDLH